MKKKMNIYFIKYKKKIKPKIPVDLFDNLVFSLELFGWTIFLESPTGLNNQRYDRTPTFMHIKILFGNCIEKFFLLDYFNESKNILFRLIKDGNKNHIYFSPAFGHEDIWSLSYYDDSTVWRNGKYSCSLVYVYHNTPSYEPELLDRNIIQRLYPVLMTLKGLLSEKRIQIHFDNIINYNQVLKVIDDNVRLIHQFYVF